VTGLPPKFLPATSGEISGHSTQVLLCGEQDVTKSRADAVRPLEPSSPWSCISQV
jgi:hypothetical protein